MKVLVWRGYGVVDVYAADTLNQLIKILDDVYIIMRSWNYPNITKDVDNTNGVIEEYLKTTKDELPRQLIKVRNSIRNLVERNCEGDDSFEHFSFDDVKNYENN